VEATYVVMLACYKGVVPPQKGNRYSSFGERLVEEVKLNRPSHAYSLFTGVGNMTHTSVAPIPYLE